MKTRSILLALFLFVSIQTFSQKFYLGDRLNPKTTEFKLLGISSSTGVSSYHYIGAIPDKNYYERKIADIVVGVKNGIIVLTIYNVIPNAGDVGVPKPIIDLIQSTLSFPLTQRGDVYGVNIDNTTISISRSNNAMTFNKDRIMFLTSLKNSLLKN